MLDKLAGELAGSELRSSTSAATVSTMSSKNRSSYSKEHTGSDDQNFEDAAAAVRIHVKDYFDPGWCQQDRSDE